VADCRFLPNPHWIPELAPMTGQDQPVREYILSQPGAKEFLRHYAELLHVVLPGYEREGKRFVTLAVGCTGGKHRSVAIADEMAAQASFTSPAGETLLAGLAPGTRNMLDGALLGYRDLFFTGNLGQLVWTRDLFALAADPGASPGEPIDVAGGTRLLIFGPYIQLPGGSWTAQVVLGFSAEAAVHTFLVDVYAEGQLAATTFRPEVAGIYRAELAFSVGEPGGKGVEVRIGVIDHDGHGSGQVAFGQVVLRLLAMRHTEEAAPAGEDFTLVLAL